MGCVRLFKSASENAMCILYYLRIVHRAAEREKETAKEQESTSDACSPLSKSVRATRLTKWIKFHWRARMAISLNIMGIQCGGFVELCGINTHSLI